MEVNASEMILYMIIFIVEDCEAYGKGCCGMFSRAREKGECASVVVL